VIRRGFWLATGAVLGVTGYRRLTRFARDLTGSAGGALPTGTPGEGARTAAGDAAPPRLAPRAAAGYPVRRPRAGTVARIVATMRFARDVRAGMAEYLDLHHRELARTLGSRSGRASSG
jgi:hypothetical protein